jgi:tetratricopeptide (TPR) repeat protein
VIRHGFPGGVFRPVDQRTGAPVIVKQARPHGGADLTGHDMQLAIELYGPAGDPIGRADIYRNLCWPAQKRGYPREALDHAERALPLYQEAGHRVGYGRMLNNIGWMRGQLGDHEAALALCRQALAVQQEIGDSLSAAHTWDSLGYAHRCLGQHDEALACYRRAIDLFMKPGGVPRDAAMTWTCLWDTRHEPATHRARAKRGSARWRSSTSSAMRPPTASDASSRIHR